MFVDFNYQDHVLEEQSPSPMSCKWLKQMEVQGCAELWNIVAVVRLPQTGADSVAGFSHLKIVCSCEPNYNGMYYLHALSKSNYDPHQGM